MDLSALADDGGALALSECAAKAAAIFGAEAPRMLGHPDNRLDSVDRLDIIEALECYEIEMRPFPHPRSTEAITALARVRGSHAGLTAAEAFETILDIKD